MSGQQCIKPITESDYNDVIIFLRKTFFKDEPLNASVNLLETEDGTCPELERYSLQIIKDKMSVMVVSEKGDVIAVCLNGVILKGETHDNEEGYIENAKFMKVMRFMRYTEQMANIFEKYSNVDKVLIVKILAVDRCCRHAGLAKKLLEKSRQMAKDQGFGLMRGDCTSFYSAKAFASLGFQCIFSINYSDYKEDEEIVFRTKPPHESFMFYVQKI